MWKRFGWAAVTVFGCAFTVLCVMQFVSMPATPRCYPGAGCESKGLYVNYILLSIVITLAGAHQFFRGNKQ